MSKTGKYCFGTRRDATIVFRKFLLLVQDRPVSLVLTPAAEAPSWRVVRPSFALFRESMPLIHTFRVPSGKKPPHQKSLRPSPKTKSNVKRTAFITSWVYRSNVRYLDLSARPLRRNSSISKIWTSLKRCIADRRTYLVTVEWYAHASPLGFHSTSAERGSCRHPRRHR